MDTENTMTEAPEITEEELAAFDDDWGDDVEAEDDFGLDEGDTQPEETEAGAEGQTEAEGEEPEADPQPDTAGEGEQKYTLKHLREEKTVGLEEMLTLAQKGMDYDSLKTDRDSLRTERDRLKSYEAFLNEMAEKSGSKSIEEQMTRSRAMWLKSTEAANGKSMSDTEAIFEVQRQQANAGSGEKSEEKPEETPQRQSMFTAFIDEFPDVKAADIPSEVWDECAKTGDLAGSYRKYENQKLKTELETLRKNQTNKDRSTGSRKSSGAATPRDPFDEAWESF